MNDLVEGADVLSRYGLGRTKSDAELLESIRSVAGLGLYETIEEQHPDNHFEQLLIDMDEAGYDAWLSKLENAERELMFRYINIYGEYKRVVDHAKEVKNNMDQYKHLDDPYGFIFQLYRNRVNLYLEMQKTKGDLDDIRMLKKKIKGRRFASYVDEIMDMATDAEIYL